MATSAVSTSGSPGTPPRSRRGAAGDPTSPSASWGTVREDYSANGRRLGLLPHDLARSKAYRWGEDGLAGICDRYQILVLRPGALERARPHPEGAAVRPRPVGGQPRRGREGVLLLPRLHADPLLHEVALQVSAARLSLPAASSRRTGAAAARAREYELLDTGIFDDDRYFDVVVEYAKAGAGRHRHPRSPSTNRGPEAAPIHVLPHLWFRNTWAWGGRSDRRAQHHARSAGRRFLTPPGRRPHRRAPQGPALRLSPRHAVSLPGERRRAPVHGQRDERAAGLRAVGEEPQALGQGRLPSLRRRRRGLRQPRRGGDEGVRATTASLCRRAARSSLRLRLTRRAPRRPPRATSTRSWTSARPRPMSSTPRSATPRPPRRTRSACSARPSPGMLWSKQIYLFDVNLLARTATTRAGRLPSHGIAFATTTGGISTRCASSRCPTSGSTPGSPPGTWPSTAWPLALVDPEFAKEQLWLLLFEQFQHPVGQIPAYEWEFSDLNPPVHAWAVWRVYNMDRIRSGKADRAVPGALLPQAAHQLRLVGEQGRQRGQQRLRRRLPRSRQHHGDRPQREAAPAARPSSSRTPRAGWACSA